MLTENHVMPDVNEVIYFAAFTNYGGVERRSVDGAISPNLYIIVNDYVTDLGDFEMTPLIKNITVPIGTNDRARVNRDALAQLRTGIQYDVGIQARVVAYAAVTAEMVAAD